MDVGAGLGVRFPARRYRAHSAVVRVYTHWAPAVTNRYGRPGTLFVTRRPDRTAGCPRQLDDQDYPATPLGWPSSIRPSTGTGPSKIQAAKSQGVTVIRGDHITHILTERDEIGDEPGTYSDPETFLSPVPGSASPHGGAVERGAHLPFAPQLATAQYLIGWEATLRSC